MLVKEATGEFMWSIYLYCQTSYIRHIKFQNLHVSHPVLQLSLPNPLKPGVKSKCVPHQATILSNAGLLLTNSCEQISIYF